jgi:hypothetical protein
MFDIANFAKSLQIRQISKHIFLHQNDIEKSSKQQKNKIKPYSECELDASRASGARMSEQGNPTG